MKRPLSFMYNRVGRKGGVDLVIRRGSLVGVGLAIVDKGDTLHLIDTLVSCQEVDNASALDWPSTDALMMMVEGRVEC